MELLNLVRRLSLSLVLGFPLASLPAPAQEKPQPAVTVDLKPLGASPDLFTDQSDSKYQQRGVIALFWVASDRLAVAFSTNHRWSGSEKPEALRVRLVIFNPKGQQQNERDWNFGDQGPDGEMTLEFAPGPDNSILAIYETPNEGKIPEGNFIQVLNRDTSRRQDFYVPSTSLYLATISPEPQLVLQTFYLDKHTSLAWWSGRPLKAGEQVDLAAASEEVIAGPTAAARALCATPDSCSGIHVSRPGAPTAMYANPHYGEMVPFPLAFLSATDLLVEMRPPDKKVGQLSVIHQNGAQVSLAALPKGLQAIVVSSVSADGQRFTVDAGGEAGLCGGLDIWCKQRGLALVFDRSANRIVFQQEIASVGGVSAISPDGKQVAIFDRDKLAIYQLQ